MVAHHDRKMLEMQQVEDAKRDRVRWKGVGADNDEEENRTKSSGKRGW